jgi:hypothetical protein
MDECSREDSNLHGLPHTVLSRTRLPVPPREQGRREAIEEMRDVKEKQNRGKAQGGWGAHSVPYSGIADHELASARLNEDELEHAQLLPFDFCLPFNSGASASEHKEMGRGF